MCISPRTRGTFLLPLLGLRLYFVVIFKALDSHISLFISSVSLFFVSSFFVVSIDLSMYLGCRRSCIVVVVSSTTAWNRVAYSLNCIMMWRLIS